MPVPPALPEPSPSDLFALALLRIDGVGKVSARRVLDAFPDAQEAARYPTEQLRLRLKHIPRADELAGLLRDPDRMQPYLDSAREEIEELARKRVAVLTPRSSHWPGGVDALDRGQRPLVLYAYGNVALSQQPVVAVFATAPLAEQPFEQAQALIRHLVARQITPATKAADGFDVVVHRIASQAAPPRPGLLVAPCGLARIAPPMRPTVAAVVRAGGLCLAPFPMTHGPFDHDDRERALLQAAVASACVFVDPQPGSPEARALAWSREAGKPVFAITAPGADVDGVHPIRTAVDFEWVSTAATSPAR